jgi:flagellar motor switch protein FliG
MDSNRISGPVKAAILIHALGRPLADVLVKRLSESEKEIINNHLSQIRTISPEVVEQVAKEFALIAQRYKSRMGRSAAAEGGQTGTGSGASNAEGSGLKAISTLSAEEIYDLIKKEQPQTIAIILVHLNQRCQ